MSMVLDFCRASDATLQKLLDDPTLENIFEFLDSEPERTDIEKAWHGLHWLLTGTAYGGEEPLCYLIDGGHQAGEESLTYGPGRALFSKEVVAFDEALARLSPETLAQRYDPAKMMEEEIYPEIWDREDEDNLSYLLCHYAELRQFLSETRKKQLGLFIYLT